MKTKTKIEKKRARVIEYLQLIGCKGIILFGSLANGMVDESSDIDLAIAGISPRTYFKTVAVIYSIAGQKVDLITLDYIPKDFEEKIRREERRFYATWEDNKGN